MRETRPGGWLVTGVTPGLRHWAVTAQSRAGRQQRERCCVVPCVGAGEVGGAEVRWPVRREGTRLDQCLMSPGRCHDTVPAQRHCPLSVGDTLPTDTVMIQQEWYNTTTRAFLNHHHHHHHHNISHKDGAAAQTKQLWYSQQAPSRRRFIWSWVSQLLSISQSLSLHFAFFSRPLPG